VSDLLRSLLPWPVEVVRETGRSDRRGTILTMYDVERSGVWQSVVLKEYQDDNEEGDGRWAAQVGRRLEAAGMRPPATTTVAQTLGARAGALVCAHAPGRPWRQTVGTSVGDEASRAVGRWCAAMERTPLALPAATGRGVVEAAAQLEALERSTLTRVGRARGADLLSALNEPQALVTSHGNLHPENLFVTQDDLPTVTGIDLDTAAAREPAYDVGYGVAQLLVRSARRPGIAHGRTAAAALVAGYEQAGGVASRRRIAVQAARGLLQALHYEVVALGREQAAAQTLLEPFRALADGQLPT